MIVGVAIGGGVLIIVAIVMYRTCHGGRQESVRKPIEHPVHENVTILNPAYASFDQSKLQASFLYEETNLDQDQNHESRASLFVPDPDGRISLQTPQHDANSFDTPYFHTNALTHVMRGIESSPHSDRNEGYEIPMHHTHEYQSRDASDTPFYSLLKNGVGLPCEVSPHSDRNEGYEIPMHHTYEYPNKDASDTPFYSLLKNGVGLPYEVSPEGYGIPMHHHTHEYQSRDASKPPGFMEVNAGPEVRGDYTTLNGSQEVYACSTVPNSKVRSEETVLDSPYYSSLKHGDGSLYEAKDDMMMSIPSVKGNTGPEVHGDYMTSNGSKEVYARSTAPNSNARSEMPVMFPSADLGDYM